MKRFIGITLFLATAAIPSVALAQSEPPTPRPASGFALGLRQGAALQGGRNVAADPSEPVNFLHDGYDPAPAVDVAIPLQLDVGYRFPFGLTVGAYGQAARVYAGEVGVLARYGLQADFRFNRLGRVMPWLGASIGREFLRLTEGHYDSYVFEYRGAEVGLQGGLEFRLGPDGALGPFVHYAFGVYDELRIQDDQRDPGAGTSDQTFDFSEKNHAVHTWLTFGVSWTSTF